MKKNLYQVILCIVTVICIIGGTVYHVGGIARSWADFWDGKEDGSDFSGTEESGKKELEAFDSVLVDADIGNLTIKQGDSYRLSWKVKNTGAVKYELKDGRLEITQRNTKKNWAGVHNNHCEILLTIPRDVELKSVELDMAVGDVDIAGISTKSLNVKANVGDVDVESSALGDVVIDADVGSVDLENCSFGNMEVDAAVGSIDVETMQSLEDYTFDLRADVGEISVNDNDYRHGFQRDGKGTCKIRLKADVGGIDVEYP